MSSIRLRGDDDDADDHNHRNSDIPHRLIVSAIVSYAASQQSSIGHVVMSRANVVDLWAEVTTSTIHVVPGQS